MPKRLEARGVTERKILNCLIDMNKSDFRIENHGSIFLFDPQNAQSEDHLRGNVSEEAQWFGGALVVEPRYAADLAEALQAEGSQIA